MTAWVVVANLVTGLVYSTYGLMTVHDLRSHWRERGISHFGVAWVAMAFTCGPHHVEHALHLAAGGTAGAIDLLTITVGLPAGIVFFLLRVEAMRGGRGDRVVGDGVGQVLVPGVLGSSAVVAAALVTSTLGGARVFPWEVAPNVALVVLYAGIAVVLAATQGHNRRVHGRWSLSGVSLSAVFATCAAMHGSWAVHVVAGDYEPHGHLLAIDSLAVPAAAYFLWVVASLYRGSLRDWNEAAPAAERAGSSSDALASGRLGV